MASERANPKMAYLEYCHYIFWHFFEICDWNYYLTKLTRRVDPWGMGFWRNQWWGSRKLFRYLRNKIRFLRYQIFMLLTSTGSSNTNGGSTGTNEFGGGIDIAVGNRDGEWSIKKSYSKLKLWKNWNSRSRTNLTATWATRLGAARTTLFMIFSLKIFNYRDEDGDEFLSR